MSKIDKCNILYVHSSDELYGADLILLQLVEGLDKNLFQPIVVIPTDMPYKGLLSNALTKRGVEIIRLNTAILRRKYFNPIGMITYLIHLFRSTMALVGIIRRESITIIHSNTAAVIPGAIAAFLSHRPHVWHIHEIIERPRPFARFISWLVPRLSTKVVAVSEPTRDHLTKMDRLNEQKVIVIHNGIDLSRFNQNEKLASSIRNEWGIGADQPIVGMIGRISHWKGQDHFLSVARLVSDTHPETHYVIIGGTIPGQEILLEKVKDTIDQLNLSEVVVLNDFRSDIPGVMEALDIFVLPSTLPDPFPTVVLESMAARRAVVANAHGGSLELIDNNVTGFLCKPNDSKEMAEAIRFLIDNPGERNKMGENGRTRLETLFSLESFISKWTHLYESILHDNVHL